MDYPIILFALLSQLGHENASLFLRSSPPQGLDNASLFVRSSFGIPSEWYRSGNGKVSYLPKALSIVVTSWRRTAS